MTLNFQIEGNILTKKNILNFGKGRFYRSQDYEDFKNDSILQLKSQLSTEMAKLSADLFTFPLEKGRIFKVTLQFFVKKDNRDLDNLISTVLDLLQQSGIIKNDKDVCHLEGVKLKSQNELTKVVLEAW